MNDTAFASDTILVIKEEIDFDETQLQEQMYDEFAGKKFQKEYYQNRISKGSDRIWPDVYCAVTNRHRCLLCPFSYKNRRSCIDHMRAIHSCTPDEVENDQHNCNEADCGRPRPEVDSWPNLFCQTAQRHRCLHCSVSYKNRRSCIAHMKSIHRSLIPASLLCQAKPRPTQTETRQSRKPLKCQFCPKVFFHKSSLSKHRQIHPERKTDVGDPGDPAKQPFKCPKCPKRFAAWAELQRHIDKRHREFRTEPQRCLICSKVFSNKTVFKLHVKHHSEKICPVCNEIMTDNNALQDHVKALHIGKVELMCPICYKLSMSSYRHELHLNTHTGIRPYKCDICPKDYTSPGGLDRHIKKHLGIPRGGEKKCPLCSKMFRSAQHLGNHMHIHTGTRPFECNKCPMSFRSPSTLMTHIERLHEKQVYSCRVCSKGFSSRVNRQRHERSHKQVFPCRICGKEYSWRVSRTLHEKKHSKGSLFECPNCEKKFFARYQLERHIKRMHDTDGPFQCEKCSETFSNRDSLRDHMHTHAKAKDRLKYNCILCEKSCYSKQLLEGHMNFHRGERPFQCEICSKSFHGKDSLIRHYKLHTDERKFECTVCNKRFMSDVHRRVHEAMHSKAKPIQCQVCELYFVTEFQLDGHVRGRKCNPCTLKCEVIDEGDKAVAQKRDECQADTEFEESSEEQGNKIDDSDTEKHVCQLCNKMFISKRNLCFHLKKHAAVQTIC